jgi:RecG-like helicase
MTVTGEAAYQASAKIIDDVNVLIRNTDKQRQIKKITKIYKYKFGWSRKTLFLYVMKTMPEVVEFITEESLKSYNLTQLYAAMEKKQLSTLIKKLEQIEKRNESRAVEDEL